jgi:hypothetical protein
MIVDAVGLAATANYAESTMRRTPPPLTQTSKLLGLSTDELTTDLQSGKTLSSLANQKGVSSSMLVASVESDLKNNAPAGSAPSSSQLKQAASSLIQGGHGRHHHGGGGISALSLLQGTSGSSSTDATATSTSGLSNTATLLGLSGTQLASSLQSGTTLSSLASQKGVSSSDLLASVESDLKANAPQGAPALSGGQLQQVATSVINSSGFAPPSATSGAGGSGGGWSGGVSSLGATSSTTASNNLKSLASATGLDPSSLLSRLQSGQDLSSLLGSAGQTGYGSSVASSVRGGVMYDEYA